MPFIHMLGEVNEMHTHAARRVLEAEGGDVALVQLRFASGATGFLSCILVTPLYLRLAVFGSKAWVEVRNDNHPDTPGATTLTLCRAGGAPESRRYEWIDTVRANLEAFADAVEGRASYPFTDAQKIANIAVTRGPLRIGRRRPPGQASALNHTAPKPNPLKTGRISGSFGIARHSRACDSFQRGVLRMSRQSAPYRVARERNFFQGPISEQ